MKHGAGGESNSDTKNRTKQLSFEECQALSENDHFLGLTEPCVLAICRDSLEF